MNNNMSATTQHSNPRHWLGLSIWLLPLSVCAQTVPSDLVEMSLEDLFDAAVISTEERATQSKSWHVAYRYGRSVFEQYYEGTDKRSYEQVLWRPGEVRTGGNYPVVPTVITQEVHALAVAYDVDANWTVRVALPWIAQSTDHISIVPGYDAFTIDSSGVGDMVVMADRVVWRDVNSSLRLGAGVSAPTGSIDEQGDTPRAPGNQQLPYTMQLGSGTWDIPLAILYEQLGEGYRWGINTRATLRTGESDRDYRLGNKVSGSVWASMTNWGRIEPGVRLDYRWQDRIDGEDASLRIPNPTFPYPAPVVDPNAFGGQQLDLSAFVDIDLSTDWFIRAEVSKPLYLNLNGPQSGENYHVGITLSTTF